MLELRRRFAVNRTSSTHRAQCFRYYYFPLLLLSFIINCKIIPREGERTRAFRIDMPLEIRICDTRARVSIRPRMRNDKCTCMRIVHTVHTYHRRCRVVLCERSKRPTKPTDQPAALLLRGGTVQFARAEA